MATQIKEGDQVVILYDFPRLPTGVREGTVMSVVGEGWFRVFSLYRTPTGEKTNIQDFPSYQLRRCVKVESGRLS